MGKTNRAAGKLESLSEVQTVDPVTDPFDVIAVVTAPDLSAVGDLVTGEVHGISGVLRTITCLSLYAT